MKRKSRHLSQHLIRVCGTADVPGGLQAGFVRPRLAANTPVVRQQLPGIEVHLWALGVGFGSVDVDENRTIAVGFHLYSHHAHRRTEEIVTWGRWLLDFYSECLAGLANTVRVLEKIHADSLMYTVQVQLYS